MSPRKTSTETATRELIDAFPNQIVRASAGTGKTFALSNRYLRLLAFGVEAQSILATTFTRKGAGEILDRIVGRLSEAALDSGAADKLSTELDWKLTSERAAGILHQTLRNLHRLEIGTLDRFFNRFAKAFSLELGLPATWEIVEQQQVERLQDQAIQTILYSETVTSLLHLISKGESKRKIDAEVRMIVDDLYSVFQEATTDAWEQVPRMGTQIKEQQWPELLEQMQAMELPDSKPFRKAWEALPDLIQTEAWETMLSKGIISKVSQGETVFNRKPIPDAFLAVAQSICDHCAAVLSGQLIHSNTGTRNLLQQFRDAYEPLKSITGQLRFEDVTNRLEMLIESVSAERMAFRLDNQVQHLLLDEFQDTSPAQWNILRPFARRVTDEDTAQNSFFCVGDVKQAIFGWRGGVAEVFDLVNDELPNLSPADALTKSYRSSPHVIQFVNDVFFNLDRYQYKDSLLSDTVAGWSERFTEHSTARTELPGCATVEVAAAIEGDNGKTDAKESLRAASVDKVQQLFEDLPDSKSIGVLVRTNDEIGDIIFRLQQIGIPASEEGGNALTDSAAVEIVLAALKLADAPGDSIARFRLSHSPLGAYYDLPEESHDNQKACAAAANVASRTIRRQLISDGYGATIETMARVLAADCTPRELTRLQQLVQVAYASEAGRDLWQLRPGRFVDYIRDEYRAVEPSSARVRVMTIHRSKGLEFDAVVVPLSSTKTLYKGSAKVLTRRETPASPIDIVTRAPNKHLLPLLPTRIQTLADQRKQQEIGEAMCVLYVSITRAVNATHVILSPGTKATNNSAASVVLSAVGGEEADEESRAVYETGDLDWFRKLPDNANLEESESTTNSQAFQHFYLPADAALTAGTIAQEARSHRSSATSKPSSTAETGSITFADKLAHSQHGAAMSQGVLIHACFEAIGWLDEGQQVTNEILFDRLSQLSGADENIDDAIAAFRSALETAAVKGLLTKASFLPGTPFEACDKLVVRNEHRFAVETTSGLKSGVIDRLVLGYVNNQPIAAAIIDFKSDKIPVEAAATQATHYQSQLADYQSAIADTFSLTGDQITQQIVFTEIGIVVPLPGSAADSSSPIKTKKKKKRTKGSDKPQDQQQTLW